MEEESPTRHHPHHLSSLVVRPTDSGGGGSDYEPGEVRRDPPSYTRSDRYNDSGRYNDSSGHVRRADSVSPLPQRKMDDRYRPDFNNSTGPHVMRADSVSPLHHRKVDDHYRSDFNTSSTHVMHAAPVSPFRHRKAEDRYRPDFDNPISPHAIRADSGSPLRHRKVDDRYRSDFDNSSGPHVMHPGSVSPMRQRKMDNHYRSDFGNPSGPLRGRGFRGGRAPGRFRDFSPPFGRARGLGRPPGRYFDRPGFDHGPSRNDGMARNSPNVAPRDGDWMCQDATCGNLNFARRSHCNKCNKPRFGPGISPRRNYPGPPRFSGPAYDRSPVRGGLNGFRSPPRGEWGRGGPREFEAGPPHLRHGGRFPDRPIRRERRDYPEDDYDDRGRFDRPVPLDWEPEDRGRENFNARRGYDGRNARRSPSPLPLPPPPPLPLPPSRDRWAHDSRERSRSPIMGGPLKDHPRSAFMERGRGRGRGPRWGMARDRFDDQPY